MVRCAVWHRGDACCCGARGGVAVAVVWLARASRRRVVPGAGAVNRNIYTACTECRASPCWLLMTS